MRKTKCLVLLLVLLQSTRLLVAQDSTTTTKTSCRANSNAAWRIDGNSTQNIGQFKRPGELDNKPVSRESLIVESILPTADKASNAHIITFKELHPKEKSFSKITSLFKRGYSSCSFNC